MARPSKKSIARSINGRKNVLKRFDIASQATQRHAEARGGQDAEELQVVEVRLSQSEIDNALKSLCFRPEADKRLKYTTRPGGSERSIRRFKAKFRNVDASIKPLAAFNFTKTEVSTGPFSDEVRKQQDQEHGRSQSTAEEILNDRETDTANGENEMIFEECEEAADDYALETPVNIVALLERIEVRLQGRKKMPADEALQLMVLKHYFMAQLAGKGKMKASMDSAFHNFDKGLYMSRVIRGWASIYEHTESLPPLSKRGKHAKWRSALDDEDVREQCLSYFRLLPPNARSAAKLKAYYEQVVYPEVTGSMNKATISLTTITRYLQLWGFTLKGHTKDIYYDGHERPDVVEYRKSWATTMMNYRTKMREYGGEDCSEVLMPDLQDGEKEIVLVTHDECYFNSNDDVTITWTENGESIIKKKGQGLGLMVSDFCRACHGSLQFDGQYAREIIEPGKNRDGFWISDDMVRQLGRAMEIFEKSHSGCIGLFCFDQSSNHQALPPEALVIRKLTLKDKRTNAYIKPGYFELNGQHYVQDI